MHAVHNYIIDGLLISLSCSILIKKERKLYPFPVKYFIYRNNNISVLFRFKLGKAVPQFQFRYRFFRRQIHGVLKF